MSNLTLLSEYLNRSEIMKDTTLLILNTFEKRLTKLEETIMPIYKETGNLQHRYENIEKTLSVLDHVIGYYHVADEVEPTIRDGPSLGLDNYIKCMGRLSKAVKYLTDNNPGSSEMAQVLTAYDSGKEGLEKEFRSLLSKYGRPIPPAVLLNLIIAEDNGVSEAKEVVEQLPIAVLESLQKISAWLLDCGIETYFMGSYANYRSSILTRSLNDLKEYAKSMANKEGMSLGIGQSPSIKQKLRETPRKQTKGVIGRATSMLKKSPINLDNQGLKTNFAVMKDDLGEIDTNTFVYTITGLLRLFKCEESLMKDIIPVKHRKKIFDSLVISGLNLVDKEGKQICQFIRRASARHNSTAAINLFPVLRQLRQLMPSFQLSLENCQESTRNKLPLLVGVFDTTCVKVLEEFIENIRNDPDKQSSMPKDGTVHEITSNTLFFMEQLLDFSDVVGFMLLSQGPSPALKMPDNEKPQLKLAEYLTKVLSALGLNLNNKSEIYGEGTTIQSIFMLNNFNYIINALRRSGLLDLVHLWNGEVENFYADQILNQKRIYSQSWSRVLHYISENQQPFEIGSNVDFKIKEKDRNLIKEKFTGFNKELDDISRNQRTLAVPDSELRQCLLEDNKTYVLPYYSAFLKRFQNCGFTKNPQKYVKFTEADLIRCIDGFFDAKG